MSRARHKMKKAMGGSVKPVWNAGGGQNAAKEAEEKKHGGRVHGEGEHSKKRMDHRARGGAIARKHGGKAEHEHKEHERARGGSVRGRARGGGIGANRMPLSTAAKIKEVTKGEMAEDSPKND